MMTDNFSDDSTFQDQTKIIRAESSRSASSLQHQNFQHSMSGGAIGSQHSMYNARCGSSMSERSIDSNATFSAVDIVQAVKNQCFNLHDLRIIKNALDKYSPNRIEKKRRKLLRNTRQPSGYDSGEIGSVSSMSSDDAVCRAVRTTRSASPAEEQSTSRTNYDLTKRRFNNEDDDTNSLPQKKRIKLASPQKNVGTKKRPQKLFSQKADIADNNASSDTIEENSPQSNMYSMIQKEKNQTRKLVTSQSCMNRDLGDESNLLDSIHKIVPAEQMSLTSATNRTDIRNKSKPENNTTNYVTLALKTCNNYEESDTYTDEETFKTNETVIKPKTTTTKSIETIKENLPKQIANKSRPSPIKNPKVNSLEENCGKQKASFWDSDEESDTVNNSSSEKTIIDSNATFSAVDVTKALKNQTFKSASPAEQNKQQAQASTSTSRTNYDLTKRRFNNEDDDTNSLPQKRRIKLTSTQKNFGTKKRPQKLFAQKADIADNNASSDTIEENSPQSNMYSMIQKEKNQTRKLVTSQSCMNRDLGDESNLLDSIHKIVPAEQMSLTSATNRTDIRNKSKPENNTTNYVTLALKTCNNYEESDTYTGEESDTYTDEETFKTNETVIKPKTTTTQQIANKSRPSPIKNPKVNSLEENCGKHKASSWDSDEESDTVNNSSSEKTIIGDSSAISANETVSQSHIKCEGCGEVLVSDVEEDELKNIGCDTCEAWFHLKCTMQQGKPYEQVAQEEFLCDVCNPTFS